MSKFSYESLTRREFIILHDGLAWRPYHIDGLFPTLRVNASDAVAFPNNASGVFKKFKGGRLCTPSPSSFFRVENPQAFTSSKSVGGYYDFSLDMWIYPTSWYGENLIYLATSNDGGGSRWRCHIRGSGFYINGDMGDYNFPTVQPIALNAWHHVVIQKKGTLFAVSIDGVEAGRVTYNSNYDMAGLNFGSNFGNSDYNTFFRGWMEGEHLIIGETPFWGTTYTVPTEPSQGTEWGSAFKLKDQVFRGDMYPETRSYARHFLPSFKKKDVEFGGTRVLAGNVYEHLLSTDFPVAREVKLLDAATGRHLKTVWSAEDGSYEFNHMSPTKNFIIVAHDHTKRFNAVIRDSEHVEEVVLTGEVLDNDPEPFWRNVVLNMPMENFLDLTGKNVTNSGGVLVTAEKARGTSSLFCNGTKVGIASADFAFGLGDFTVEFFYRPNNSGGHGGTYARLLQIGNNNQAGGLWIVLPPGSPSGILVQGHNGSSYINIVGYLGTPVPNSVWHHVALTRSNKMYRLFVDGVLYGTGSDQPNYSHTVGSVWLGANESNGETFAGHLDNVRITRGIARYTTNFNPADVTETYSNPSVDPVAPSLVKFYCKMDASQAGFVDETGKPILDSAFAGGSPPTRVNYQGVECGFFSGSYPCWVESMWNTPTQDFNFGTGETTIEFFVNPDPNVTNGQAGRMIMFGGNADANSMQMSLNVDGSLWFGEPTTNNPISGIYAPPGTVTFGVWQHIAMVFESPTIYAIYVNGVQIVRATTGKPWGSVARSIVIGMDKTISALTFRGWMRHVRVTKAARYLANFDMNSWI